MKNRAWFLALFLYASEKLTVKPEASGKLLHIVYLEEKEHDPKPSTEQKEGFEIDGVQLYTCLFWVCGKAHKISSPSARCELLQMSGVVRVLPNVLYELHTTRSWDFLGLSPSLSPSNLLQISNLGDGVIIGVLDSGIWPESEAFNEEGLGPVPRRWRGVCQSEEQFNATRDCNRKIIGAKWYVDGFIAELGEFNRSAVIEFMCPRDSNGHGTQTASTAAGSFVRNVSYRGIGGGTVRGGAPAARQAVYKACWSLPGGGGQCAAADVLKGLDDVVHDGVDVVSVAGESVPLFAEVDEENAVAIGSFGANLRNISVVCFAGNDGPSAETVVYIL